MLLGASIPGEADQAAEPRPAVSAPASLTIISCRPESAAVIRRALVEVGAAVVAHLAPHRWLVAGDPVAVAGVPGLMKSRPWRPAEGVHGELRALAAPEKGTGDDVVFVAAALAPGRSVRAAAELFETMGAEPSWLDESARPAPQFGFSSPRSRLREVVEQLDRTPGLVWAEPQAPVRLLNSESVWRCQSGLPDQTPIFHRGLRGQGQVIGIMDTGIDIDECRLAPLGTR